MIPNLMRSMTAMVPLLMLTFMVVSVAVGVLKARGGRGRMDDAVAQLSQQGYSVIPKIATPPSFPFPEFSHRKGKVRLHITQPDTFDTAFHYTYSYSRKVNDRRSTVRLSCAVVPLPLNAPMTSIWKGSRSIIGMVIGNRVDVGSERFNSLYEVDGTDERFVVTLLSDEVIDWFLSEPAISSGVTVRIAGNWMLLVRPVVEHHELPGMLVMAQELRDRMPRVLPSIYPVPQ